MHCLLLATCSAYQLTIPYDSFLRRLAEVNTSGSPPFTSPQDLALHLASTPLLAGADEAMWASLGDTAQRDSIFAEFRQGARSTLAELLALLESEDVGGLPDELHYLLGQCRTVGAWRMQLAVEGCKASFDHAKLATLSALLALTFEAMDERSGGAPHAATALQRTQAEAMAELAAQKRHANGSSASSGSGLSLSAGLAAPVSGAHVASTSVLAESGAAAAREAAVTAAAAVDADADADAAAATDGETTLPAASLFVAGLDDVSFARQWQEP